MAIEHGYLQHFTTDNNSGNLTDAIKGLTTLGERKQSEFRDWHEKPTVILGVMRRDIARLIKSQTDPT